MPARSDDAHILTRSPYRERDWLVTALTRQRGLQRLLARRARGVRSPLSGVLEPLGRVRLSYWDRPRSELASLDEASLSRSSFALAQRPRAWAAGCVVAELALLYCPPAEAAEAAFRLVDHCVGALLGGHPPAVVAHYALLWFLRLAGVFPDLGACGECGADLGSGPVSWDASRSEFFCARHRPGAVTLPVEALQWLRRASRSPVEAVAPPPGQAVAWLVTVQERFSDREVKSLHYLQRLTQERPEPR